MNLFFIQINVSRPGLGRIFSIINQNKLDTQHAVRINTVHNRKEKKKLRERREEIGEEGEIGWGKREVKGERQGGGRAEQR